MPSALEVAKRVVVGQPMRSELLGETLLPKKIALPVFASDALSSVAYATEEILLVLSAGGLALFHFTWWIAAAVALLMLIVVASYRQNVHAYPSGGGDYEVATTNLGPKVGLTVASALMVDYILTVAVSVSSGVANLASAFPALNAHVVLISVAVIAVITLLNLRGVRESGTAFAVPTYCFIASIALMIIWGFVKIVTGDGVRAESANYTIENTHHYSGVLLVFMLLRAFASGCTALTGVEAISNGVPAFQKPKSKNAATTLALLGAIAVSMFAGVTALALAAKVHIADTTSGTKLVGLPAGEEQKTVIAQVSAAVFGHGSALFYVLQFITAIILVLAANTAFNGFPVLGSILARDGALPRQLHTRGDRLAFSNGILLLSGFAILLVVAFSASPTRLIQLYIVGVFVSFVCSQTGMIRHWNRNLKDTADAAERRRMKRSRVINAIGAGFTAVVLCIVLTTKFAKGAWIVVVAMPLIWLLMRAIQKHYASVAAELLPPEDGSVSLPTNNHAIVLVSKLHLPTLRAIGYAKATKPSRLEAVTVALDDAEVAALRDEWERREIPVPLTVIDSPYREITTPVVEYVKRLRTENPNDIVTVYVPEYVLGHWWEQLLHNQSALRLKARLRYQRRVVVASVPYQMASATAQLEALHAASASHRAGAATTVRSGAKSALKAIEQKRRLSRLERLTAEAHELEAEEVHATVIECGATPIGACADRQQVTIAGTLRTVVTRPRAGVPVLEADLWDGTGSVTVSWLGRRSIPGIAPGRNIVVHGRITTMPGGRAVFNPVYELRPGSGD